MIRRKSLRMLSVLSIALASVAAHAAAPAPVYNNFNLAIPNLTPGFEVSLGAIWLKPSAANLNYVIYNKELPVQTPGWIEQELRPSYDPAFEFGLRYVFKNAPGQDINLDWVHFYSSTSSTTVAPDASFFLGPDYQIGPEGLPIRNAAGNVKFRYDVVNLDVGQYLNFGQHLQMRFFGGLSTGFLREEVVSVYSGTATGAYPGPFRSMQDVKSNFAGIGPRVGMHADYSMECGLGFLGEAGLSALMGSLGAKTSYTESAAQLLAVYGQAVNYQTIADQSIQQVIPGFDAKLGVEYKHAFNNNLLFTVSAGYQGAVYINAISQYLPQTLVAGQPLQTGGIFVATMSHKLSNYSVQGPFLNFALKVS